MLLISFACDDYVVNVTGHTVYILKDGVHYTLKNSGSRGNPKRVMNFRDSSSKTMIVGMREI